LDPRTSSHSFCALVLLGYGVCRYVETVVSCSLSVILRTFRLATPCASGWPLALVIASPALIQRADTAQASRAHAIMGSPQSFVHEAVNRACPAVG